MSTSKIVKPDDLTVLFVGNSFTYFNDMPTIFKNMAVLEGIDVYVDQLTYGGASLDMYLNKETDKGKELVKKLALRKWDYVVLQEQSSKPHMDKEGFFASVTALASRINKIGAKTVLYSTWSYKEGSNMLQEHINLPYSKFYESLTKSYIQAANRVDALIVPVGTVFYELNIKHKEIELLVKDDFHPNIIGSYIAAHLFYNILCNKDDSPSYIPKGISKSIVSIIQNTVKQTVTTSTRTKK